MMLLKQAKQHFLWKTQLKTHAYGSKTRIACATRAVSCRWRTSMWHKFMLLGTQKLWAQRPIPWHTNPVSPRITACHPYIVPCPFVPNQQDLTRIYLLIFSYFNDQKRSSDGVTALMCQCWLWWQAYITIQFTIIYMSAKYYTMFYHQMSFHQHQQYLYSQGINLVTDDDNQEYDPPPRH